MFGEEDPDQDVSPDTEDPEAAAAAGDAALAQEAKANTIGGIERKSTRTWAQECGYDAVKLFTKFFNDDIKYLLSMENLWKKRKPPVPVAWGHLPDSGRLRITFTLYFCVISTLMGNVNRAVYAQHFIVQCFMTVC